MKEAILCTLCACMPFLSHAQGNGYLGRCYKGDVALGLNVDFGCESGGACLFTTHGFQLNETWFVGGGIGYENEMFPLYVDAKAYFRKREMKVNPWTETKLGFDMFNGGCYLSPSVGIALPLMKDYALTVALAWGMNTYYAEHNIGLRVGFQF